MRRKTAFTGGDIGNEILVIKVLLGWKSSEIGVAYKVDIVPSLIYGQWIGQSEGGALWYNLRALNVPLRLSLHGDMVP